MRFFSKLNFDLVPFLIDKLKTPDKRKEDVNGIIYTLLMTRMLEGYPPIINVIRNYIQIPGQEYIAVKLLSDQLTHGCQTVWRNVFEILYPEQMGDKMIGEREGGRDDWTANTLGPASSSPQWHLCQICIVPEGHQVLWSPILWNYLYSVDENYL